MLVSFLIVFSKDMFPVLGVQVTTDLTIGALSRKQRETFRLGLSQDAGFALCQSTLCRTS